MEQPRGTSRTVYELFRISLVIRALGAFAEVLAGIFIALIPNAFILHLALTVSQLDIDGSLDDSLVQVFITSLHWLIASNQLIIGAYLAFRGLIQLVLVWELFRNRLWAYVGLMIVVGIFILTQCIDIYRTHAIPTILITLFDLVTLWLTWNEYQKVRKA